MVEKDVSDLRQLISCYDIDGWLSTDGGIARKWPYDLRWQAVE